MLKNPIILDEVPKINFSISRFYMRLLQNITKKIET